MQGILKKKMNLLKTALNCQYGIPILPQTHLLQNQIIREEVQERKNKSFWMILQDFKGKKRKLMRKLKLSGRILNKKLRTWLLRQELLSLAVLTFLVLLAQQLKLAQQINILNVNPSNVDLIHQTVALIPLDGPFILNGSLQPIKDDSQDV
ncbi:hypothetical protein Tco_0613714 [Tanacetum coccineum]